MKKLLVALILCLAVAMGAIIFMFSKMSGMNPTVSKGPDPTVPAVTSAPVSGWVTENGVRKYLLNGTPASGWLQTDGKNYYLNPDGTVFTGWLDLGGKRYYLQEDGARATGWLDWNGQRYYLDETGAMVTVPTVIDGVEHRFQADGTLLSGWYEDAEGRHYADETGAMAIGWKEIDGDTYCFDENGVIRTGWVDGPNGQRYMLENGRMAKGKVMIDDAAHFFSSTGAEFYMVNPWNYLPEGYTVDLVKTDFGHRIANYAAEDLAEMLDACREAGHKPYIRSSYRTHSHQKTLYQNKVNRFVSSGYSRERAKAKAATIVAIPGTSEHQMGLALDIVDNKYRQLDHKQAETITQQWLMENSWKYGFILRYPTSKGELTGIIYEPWHYRYVGRELAAELHELDLCLEEYVDMLTPKAEE